MGVHRFNPVVLSSTPGEQEYRVCCSQVECDIDWAPKNRATGVGHIPLTADRSCVECDVLYKQAALDPAELTCTWLSTSSPEVLECTACSSGSMASFTEF